MTIELVKNTLKEGGTEKGRGNKYLKKRGGGGGASWVNRWVPEKEGLEPP